MTYGLRRAAGVLGALLTLAALALGGASPAAAHPTLLFTEPAADTAVSDAPQVITLMFNEAVSIGPDAIAVLDKDGRAVPISSATTQRQGQVVTARLAAALPSGSYTVRWRATGTDGDLVEEEFRFGVGYALAPTASGAAQPPIAWLSAGLRWLLLAGLAIAFGGLIAQRFIVSARAENPRLARPWSPITGSLVMALVGGAGLAAQLVADAGEPNVLWREGSGPVVLTEIIAVAVALTLVSVRRRGWAPLALLVAVGAEGWRSHAQTAAPGWGALLTGVHLAAAAIWAGALVQTTLAVVAWRREPAAVRWMMRGYMRLAVWTFVVVIGTGVLSALLLVPLSQIVSTSYGRVLLIKVALAATAAALALAARRIQRNETQISLLTRVMRIESLTLVAVLALSATLVSTAPVTAAVQPAAPPPRGLLMPLGALAGQIGVAVAASDGQLVVRLAAPRLGDYYTAQPGRRYTLSGRLGGPSGDGALMFRGCGQGCFVANTAWSAGDNVLSLAAGADDAKGGSVSMLVPWPPVNGSDELARAVAATRTAGDITVYESVSSDSTTGTGERHPLQLTAQFFVSQEPYAAGTAPQAVRVVSGSGSVRLALGYPAASINVVLTLDKAGRIVDETLTDPSHLVTRRLVYPEHD